MPDVSPWFLTRQGDKDDPGDVGGPRDERRMINGRARRCADNIMRCIVFWRSRVCAVGPRRTLKKRARGSVSARESRSQAFGYIPS